jgi:hypothetical protein
MFGKLENFGIFAEHGPLWRAFVADLEEAKMKAQQIAIDDGEEVFIFSFKDASEVAHFFPKPKPKQRKRSPTTPARPVALKFYFVSDAEACCRADAPRGGISQRVDRQLLSSRRRLSEWPPVRQNRPRKRRRDDAQAVRSQIDAEQAS